MCQVVSDRDLAFRFIGGGTLGDLQRDHRDRSNTGSDTSVTERPGQFRMLSDELHVRAIKFGACGDGFDHPAADEKSPGSDSSTGADEGLHGAGEVPEPLGHVRGRVGDVGDHRQELGAEADPSILDVVQSHSDLRGGRTLPGGVRVKKGRTVPHARVGDLQLLGQETTRQGKTLKRVRATDTVDADGGQDRINIPALLLELPQPLNEGRSGPSSVLLERLLEIDTGHSRQGFETVATLAHRSRDLDQPLRHCGAASLHLNTSRGDR